MLRPVELDAAGNPGSGQADQRRFDDAIVIDEVKVVGLVASHLHAAAKPRQQHNFQVFVLQNDCCISYIGLLVGDTFDDRMGIDNAAAALIDPVFQEHGVLVRLASDIGRYNPILDANLNIATI